MPPHHTISAYLRSEPEAVRAAIPASMRRLVQALGGSPDDFATEQLRRLRREQFDRVLALMRAVSEVAPDSPVAVCDDLQTHTWPPGESSSGVSLWWVPDPHSETVALPEAGRHLRAMEPCPMSEGTLYVDERIWPPFAS